MAKQMKNPTLSGRRWQLYVLLAPFFDYFFPDDCSAGFSFYDIELF